MPPYQAGVRGELKVWQSPQERFECDLALQPRQGSAETKMSSPPEREVAIVRSTQVQPVGIGKAFGIAVAGAHYRDYRLPVADPFPSELNVCSTEACCMLSWTLIPQHC